MQKKLLDLRCVLVDKEDIMNSSQAAGWMNIMRVLQLYDDIQDVVVDDGQQDNIPLSLAFHHFPEEWDWFCLNKKLLAEKNQTSYLLSLYMPGSFSWCMQLAAEKIKTLNWEQQKIMHYLLFRCQFVLYQADFPTNGNGDCFLNEFYQK